MSALTPAAPPGIGNIMTALSSLPGSPNGPAVVSFTDSNVNMLPPLPGPSPVGAHTFSLVDYSSHSASFCDAGDVDNPDALCNQPREIRVTMFYPACPPEESGDSRPVLTDGPHFAPVFEPSLVPKVSRLALGNATAMHNLMSQAVRDAPICIGEYTLAMVTPPAGGQRQAYTQTASELAALGYIAVTVDHLYISGFVELSDGTIQAVKFDDPKLVGQFETQLGDIQFLGHALTGKAELNRLPIWTKQARVAPAPGFCVFGHGLGGQVADYMASKTGTCGQHLEGLLTLPFPLDKGDINTQRNAVQKRTVDVVDCCYGKESCDQDDCDRDRHYRDQRPCGQGRCGDHFDDYYDNCDSPCDEYDDFFPPRPPPPRTRPPPPPRPDQPNVGNGQPQDNYPVPIGGTNGRNYPSYADKYCHRNCGQAGRRPNNHFDYPPENPGGDDDCGQPDRGHHGHFDHPHRGTHSGSHGSVGHHKGWEDVHEGHRWHDHDYDYDDEDEDDEDDDDCCGDDEDDDDEEEDDDCCGEDEDDDDGDDWDDCEDEGPCD